MPRCAARSAAAALLACSLALAGCVVPPQATPVAASALTLTPAGFDQLPGWTQDDLLPAMAAFDASCARLLLMPPDEALGGDGLAAQRGGKAGDWTAVCTAARALPPDDQTAARQFLVQYLQPYALSGGTALVSGYDEPEVDGARSPGGAYRVPLLGRPLDLVQADLGAFKPSLAGTRIAGRLRAGQLIPYYSRAEIDQGVLESQRLAILWLRSPIDLFFLQIQGAGRVRLADGRIVRVGYAAQNGLPYVPIGRLLVQRGALTADQVSEASIRAWLIAHPAEAQAVMEENPSYVFFRELPPLADDKGPPGALGVSLTPGRSVAIDRHFLPLGAPLWLATTDPVDGSALRRLMVAQDLGSAITGPLRVDIFFGWGEAAVARAGRMHADGQEYVLLPRGSP